LAREKFPDEETDGNNRADHSYNNVRYGKELVFASEDISGGEDECFLAVKFGDIVILVYLICQFTILDGICVPAFG
jgi:hypothetical protein